MQFPILAKDLRLSLRRLESFISAFTFYSVMTVTVGFLWEINVHGSSNFDVMRDRAARSLFLGFIVLGFFGFCYHGAVSAARILVVEREKNTFALLQAAPLSGWKLILEKLVTPLAFELLLFFGIFPALALVFIIGGISPGEYAYQLTNLFVWILTSVTLGLWVSSRAKSSAKAARNAIVYLTILGPALPFISNLFSFFSIDSSFWSGASTLFAAPLGVFGAWLYAISPAGMIVSYYPEIASILTSLVNPTSRGFELSGNLLVYNPYQAMGVGLTPSAQWGWISHLILQIGLLRAAARNWKKSTAPTLVKRIAPRNSILGGTSRFRPTSLLPTGWIAFLAQEDRLVFRRGSWTKRLLLGSYLLLALILACAASGRSLILLSLSVILFFALALAPNSYRRERESGTSVFLLQTPYYPRDYLLAKWFYLQTVAGVILLIGFLAALFWTLLFNLALPDDSYARWAQGLYSRRFHTGRFYLYLAALVPMITLEGLMIGLRIRKKVHPIRFLIPIGVLAGGGALVLLLQWLEGFLGNRILWEASNFVYYNPWPIGVLFPYLLISGCVYLLRKGVEAPPFESAERARWRALIAQILVWYIGIDFLSLLIVPPDFSLFDLRNHIRLLIAAFAFNWFPWVWLVRRPESWWRERLLGPNAV